MHSSNFGLIEYLLAGDFFGFGGGSVKASSRGVPDCSNNKPESFFIKRTFPGYFLVDYYSSGLLIINEPDKKKNSVQK